MEWPDHSRLAALCKAWTTTVAGADIAKWCSQGILPVTDKGFTVMHVDGKPTALTCTALDTPGDVLLVPERLVTLALCCMWECMPLMSIVAYVRREQDACRGLFWATLDTMLLATPPPCVADAALVGNPWQREFVMAAWYRLQHRGSSAKIEMFVAHALCRPWEYVAGVSWPSVITRWIAELDIDHYEESTPETFAFRLGGSLSVDVHRRDAVLLFLMALFREPLRWGENGNRMPEVVAEALERCPFILLPHVCTVHKALCGINRPFVSNR